MDGKLLILCDELPGDYEKYSVRDIYFLRSMISDPTEDTDRVFVCWDSIIPQNRSFIEACMHYGMTYEKIPADFALKETGMTDGKHGSIKGSIQEDSYLNSLATNINILRATAQRGEDFKGESMDLAVQFPMQATQRFTEDFSAMLNRKGIVRILVAHKSNVDPRLIQYRTRLLDAWQNQNSFMGKKSSCAKILEPMMYSEFSEVHSRSVDEIMEIYSMPIFGEADDKEKNLIKFF